MTKMLKMGLMSILLSATLFGAATTSEEIDYRQEKRLNKCIQTAEYFEGEWKQMTERQLRASRIYNLEKFSQYEMIFGETKLMYVRTDKLKDLTMDIYSGVTDDGTKVTVSVETSHRTIFFVNIGKLHPKKVECIAPNQ